MPRSLKEDLDRLKLLPFRTRSSAEELLRWWHRHARLLTRHPDAEWITGLPGWLLTPFSLWPLPIEDVARWVRDTVNADPKLPAELQVVLEILGPAPGLQGETFTRIVEHEELGRRAEYESFFKDWNKYAEYATRLRLNPAFRSAWSRFQEVFPVQRWRDTKGILRRTMLPERNFRGDWRLDWKSERARFQVAFDAFCWRWELYGMEGDTPLPMKPTINLTPFGTMIVIPRYWSLSTKRDVKWDKVNRLHKVYGSRRQGARLSPTRLKSEETDRRALDLDMEARRRGLRGDARRLHILRGVGLSPDTDPAQVRRMLARAKKLHLARR